MYNKIIMTEYQKANLRQHFNKWGIAYSMAGFMLFALIAIGWEAKQEQKIKELEKYHTPTQDLRDIA